MASVTAIILTRNEAKNLGDCLNSIRGFASRAVVVDCYSSDRTVEIAREKGAEVVEHEFSYYAAQFNWAIDNCGITTDWILRIDADERLTQIGHELGLISDARLADVNAKYRAVQSELDRLEHTHLAPSEALNTLLADRGTAPLATGSSLADLIRRPQISYQDLACFDTERPVLPIPVIRQVEIRLRYDGYIRRQLKQVEEFRRMESRRLSPDLNYDAITGLRLEAREKLKKIRPLNFGQASRISGVSPADIAVLMIAASQPGVSEAVAEQDTVSAPTGNPAVGEKLS